MRAVDIRLLSMKVIFDQQIFALQRFGGISRSFVELNKHLNFLDDIESRIVAPLHFNKHLFDSKVTLGIYLPKSTDKFGFNKKVRSVGKWVSDLAINQFRPDLIHETFYDPKSYPYSDYPVVTTIQDLIREKIGEEKEKIAKKRESVERAKLIICISDSTKMDLLEYYKVDPSKVHRVYLGVSGFFLQEIPEGVGTWTPNNIILFVGNRSGYKNWEKFVQAFSCSKILLENFNVVCFGGGRFNDVENETLLRLGIIEKVKYLDGSDHQLKELYEKSACLVYPSLYEGFGLPVVEAMASGCPVFASDIPVLHESAGVAAKYFDPQDINSLIQALETNLFDTDKLQKMRKLGFDHAKKFTWVETAKQTYLAYKSIL